MVTSAGLVGRLAELQQLAALARAGALVTVLGPGGVGKTTLVEAWAPSGTPIARLAACVDQGDVLATLAAALGVAPAQARSPEEAAGVLGRACAGRLVVLDNGEQVLPTLRWLLEVWGGPPGTLVLTSREGLGVAGEAVLDLAPLTTDEARTLFLTRAEGPPADLARVAVLVEALDCLPLAVELAAGWSGLLSVDDMLRTAPSVLLRRSKGDRGARHGTLDASLDWSLALLEPGARQVLAACATFSGGFELADVAAVSGAAPGALLDTLEQLRRAGLLWRGSGPRALQVYGLVRHYVRHRLPAPDAVARHAAWALVTAQDLAGQVGRPGSGRSLRALDAHHPDLRDARSTSTDPAFVARCTLAAEPLFGTQRPVSEALSWLEAAPLARQAADPRLQAGLARMLGTGLERTGVHERASAVLEAAAVAAQEAQLPDEACQLWVRVAALHQGAGRAPEAEAVLRRAEALASSPGDRGEALRNLGAALRLQGRTDEAGEALERALSLAREHDVPALEMRALLSLGNLRVHTGRPAEAETLLRLSLERAQALDDDIQAAMALSNLSVLANSTGDLEVCIARADAAIARYERFGHRRGVVALQCVRAEAEVPRERPVEGVAERLREAIAAAEESGLVVQVASVTWALGIHLHRGGSLEAAQDCYRSAREGFERLGIGMGVGLAGCGLGILAGCGLGILAAWRGEGLAALEEAGEHLGESGWPFSDQVMDVARSVAQGEPQPLAALDRPGTPAEVRMLLALARGAVTAGWSIVADGSSVTVPDGVVIGLGRRGAPRRIVAALAAAHARGGGETVGGDALIAAGWPGERILPEAAASRLYTAVRTLRRLGLAPLLETRDGGYRLDPGAAVRLESVPGR